MIIVSNPRIIFVRTTEKCNANCFMCNYARNSKGKELTKEEFDELIDLMSNGEYKLIKFTGGEPLLNKNLEYFIKKSHENGYFTSIITNGFLLKNSYKKLIDAGLDHITISIDSCNPEIHDSIRGINGLFNRIIETISETKKYNSNVKIRINTVGSYLNISDLVDLYKLLKKLNIDQWTITPLKSKDNYWEPEKIEEYYKKYIEFQNTIKNEKNIQLLGYTKQWAGRNKEEFINLIKNNYLYRPCGKCYLVDKIRFYIPSKGIIVPCNSASHRIEEIQVLLDKNKGMLENADIMADWLKEKGPKVCTGCGPINVWLAENPDLIEEDIFLF